MSSIGGVQISGGPAICVSNLGLLDEIVFNGGSDDGDRRRDDDYAQRL
jgi:hypothetical protein